MQIWREKAFYFWHYVLGLYAIYTFLFEYVINCHWNYFAFIASLKNFHFLHWRDGSHSHFFILPESMLYIYICIYIVVFWNSIQIKHTNMASHSSIRASQNGNVEREKKRVFAHNKRTNFETLKCVDAMGMANSKFFFSPLCFKCTPT